MKGALAIPPTLQSAGYKEKGSTVLIIELHQSTAMSFDRPIAFSTLLNGSCLYGAAHNLIQTQSISICH